MINLKQVHKYDAICDMHQTSTFVEASSLKLSKDFTDLQEIILHFKLRLQNKDGGDE